MDKNTITTPAANLIQGYYNNREFLEQYLSLYKYPSIFGFGRNFVKWFKHLFGRQKYCFTNTQRLWVWEKTIGDRGWRVYVGNGKGICLEVHGNCSTEEALDMVNDFFFTIKSAMNGDKPIKL